MLLTALGSIILHFLVEPLSGRQIFFKVSFLVVFGLLAYAICTVFEDRSSK